MADLFIELTTGNLNQISDFLLNNGLAWYEDKLNYRAQMRRSKLNPSRYVINGTQLILMGEDNFIDLEKTLGVDPWI